MFNIPATALTAGGLAVGMGIPIHFGVAWAKANWKAKKKNWKSLVPFVGGLAYGGLASMCTGGLIGFGAGVITWLGNGAGSLALWGLAGGNSTRAVRVTPVELSAEGNIILFLVTVALIGLWKVLDKASKGMARRGVFAGVLLGLSAVLGGAVAVTVIPAVNSAGASLLGFVG
ncbi:hypothetical protein [Kitasatospora cineracea]|uniref:hypothetical protein n=1 Tax=Kitasatospora cineracea TaxID=88074 RepID=UPI0037AB1A3C